MCLRQLRNSCIAVISLYVHAMHRALFCFSWCMLLASSHFFCVCYYMSICVLFCFGKTTSTYRDIKSLNILLSRDHTVAKIADLGVSRQVSNATAFLTTCYGTPLYASPEICKSSPCDEKTDLWSLGVVLYEMAALVPPFVAPSLVGLGDAIKAGR